MTVPAGSGAGKRQPRYRRLVIRRGSTVAALALISLLALAPSAPAQDLDGVFGPYDGSIPFKCQLQNVGTGTDFPHPDADPFCVEFDKTNQNLTDFGIVEFLLQEPARVAAALPKCFYFQRDHWSGWIVQGGEPELWHWDGDYWYDIARGVGGASVRNFRIGGVAMDATPYVPAAYRPYFDPDGGGGVVVELETRPPSRCTALVDTPEERDRIYANQPAFLGCIPPGGNIRGRRVGRAHLGVGQRRLRSRLGPPTYSRPHLDAWCLVGKGELRVAYGRGGRAQMILTSASGHSVDGVSRGDRLRRASRRLDLAHRRSFKSGAVEGFRARRRPPPALWAGVDGERVRWLLLSRLAETVSERTFSRLVHRVP
jgi:hypothetical protein